MKNVVLTVILLVLCGVLALGFWPSAPTSPISPEFRKQAVATIAAIERLERFTGATPEYEATKAMDDLRGMSDTYEEDNVLAVLANYKHVIRLANITEAEKDFAERERVRRDVRAVESRLR